LCGKGNAPPVLVEASAHAAIIYNLLASAHAQAVLHGTRKALAVAALVLVHAKAHTTVVTLRRATAHTLAIHRKPAATAAVAANILV
jgi:hypothetical protein